MRGSSTIQELPPQHKVFIQYHKDTLVCGFVNHLLTALKSNNINVAMDMNEGIGMEVVLQKLEKSRIALVIFSGKYTESTWCLRELARVNDCLEKGILMAIPIFNKLDPSTVRYQMGQFGDGFMDLVAGGEEKDKWLRAMMSIASQIRFFTMNQSDVETKIVEEILVGVKRLLAEISSEGSQQASVDPSENIEIGISAGGNKILGGVKEVLNKFVDGVKEVLNKIVEGVKEVLNKIPWEGSQKAYVDQSQHIDTQISSGGENDETFGIKQRLKDHIKITSQLAMEIITQQGMRIGFLLLLVFSLYIAYMSTPLIGEGGAINGIVENIPNVLEYIPADQTENPRDKFTEVPTGKFGTNPEISSSYPTTNADSLERTFTNSPMDAKFKPPKIQVFIKFRGYQLRNNFVGYLVDALRRSEINVFIDTKATIGDDLNNLFKRIEDSGIAIVVFSSRYTESEWCLDELVKIKERAHQGMLKVLPIFYKVTPGNVKRLKGEFGDNFRDKEYMYASDEGKIKQWKEAIVFVSHKFALTFDEKSILEIDFIEIIVKEVLKMLQAISTVESRQSSR